MATSTLTLRSSLEKHNATFQTLLKLIPAKYYLMQDDSEEQANQHDRNRHRLQNESLQTAEQSGSSKKSKGKQKADAATQGPGSDGDAMDVDVIVDVDGSIEALREKLHARMAELRCGGKGDGGGGEAGSRDELLEERWKQRAAMRERRRKGTKEKIKHEEEMKGKNGKEKHKGPQTKREDADDDNDQMQLLVQDQGSSSNSGPSQDPKSKYATVAFSAVTGNPSKKADHLKTVSNPAQVLEQLAACKERLAAMPEEKRKAIEEREKWEKAEA
ncbi:uncharacterized protein LAESUDRAFT_733111 [Laetiporus sulphureus 93-53]|uniref:Ribosomal RNA-processing protein 14 N-terminal domain-containing protein n=1 Tax=Laetiporus sulphureus 93-53 TaxID=1314785 RepID=A0A165AQB8_9APHY|nr:uncharacterized protein LAESUDRAFT_733111 [Laetiporus sulphureus 93-53]KZS99448.1 hypothetical protein LAESUDRAFT_733111 [Laetiporus sulphureus 93-53]